MTKGKTDNIVQKMKELTLTGFSRKGSNQLCGSTKNKLIILKAVLAEDEKFSVFQAKCIKKSSKHKFSNNMSGGFVSGESGWNAYNLDLIP